MHIIVIIITKTISTGPSKKKYVVYKLLSQPHKHLRHEKTKKTQLMETMNSWLHSWTLPAFRCRTKCREGHSTIQSEPAGKTLQIGTIYTLILQTSMDELRPQLSMLNTIKSRWKLSEQTVIGVQINLVQHTKLCHMTSMTHRQETLIGREPGHRIHMAFKLKATFSSWLPHRTTILNPSYLGVRYITPTKDLKPNFTSLVSLI